MSSNDEYKIQPHPTEPVQPGGGLTSVPEIAAHNAKGPHILSDEIKENLEQPLSREELRKRQEELNK